MIKMKIIFIVFLMVCFASAFGNESMAETAKNSHESVLFNDSTRTLMLMNLKQCDDRREKENKILYMNSKDVDFGPQPLNARPRFTNHRSYPCDNCIASVRDKYGFVCPDSTLRSDCKSLNKCFMKYSGLRNSVNIPFVKIPEVGDNQIEVQGVLSAADALKGVRRCEGELLRIYKEYLKKRPSFQGKITLKFTIAPKGKITDITKLSSTSSFNEFDDEIENVVRRCFFPKSKSGKTTVIIPLMFYEKYVYVE